MLKTNWRNNNRKKKNKQINKREDTISNVDFYDLYLPQDLCAIPSVIVYVRTFMNISQILSSDNTYCYIIFIMLWLI